MNIEESTPDHVSQRGHGGKAASDTAGPLPPDDESPIEEEMDDVGRDAQLHEGTQVPDAPSKADNPDTKPALNNGMENQRSPGAPASDPESGA